MLLNWIWKKKGQPDSEVVEVEEASDDKDAASELSCLSKNELIALLRRSKISPSTKKGSAPTSKATGSAGSDGDEVELSSGSSSDSSTSSDDDASDSVSAEGG